MVLNGVPVTLSPQATAPLATANFSVIGHSKMGLTASITITNMGTVPIRGWSFAGLFAQFDESARLGQLSHVSDTVRRLTGQPAETLKAFLRTHRQVAVAVPTV